MRARKSPLPRRSRQLCSSRRARLRLCCSSSSSDRQSGLVPAVVLSAFVLSAAGACAAREAHPVVASRLLPSPVVSRDDESLDPRLLDAAAAKRTGSPIASARATRCWSPSTTTPSSRSPPMRGRWRLRRRRPVEPPGLYVDNDGTIQFPLIGSVRVAGKTSEELHLFLEQELARYVKEPKVTVQVLFNGSIRYYLLGQFVAPGLKYADRPMRLLEALALGDSIILDKASLRGAYVSRDGKRLPVNFRRLLRDGDMRQNIRLHGGRHDLRARQSQRAGFRVCGRGGQQRAWRGGPVHQRAARHPAGARAIGHRLPRAGAGASLRGAGHPQRGGPRPVLRRRRRQDPARRGGELPACARRHRVRPRNRP